MGKADMNIINETMLQYAMHSLNNSPDGVFWIGADGDLFYVNEAASQELGYTVEELLALQVSDFDPTMGKGDIGPAGRVTTAIRNSDITHLSTHHKHRDGHLIPVDITLSIMDSDERLVCSFVRDMTEQRTLEAALQREIDERKEVEKELRRLNEKLENVASTDFLTGAWSRRHFFEMAPKEMSRAKRYENDLSLLMIDADLFKRINDDFGHHTGDVLLAGLCELIKSNIRQSDSLIRWGGEEFIVLLPQTNQEGALACAEMLRSLIEGFDFGVGTNITVSIGVAEIQPQDDIDSWVKRADEALYRAKNAGRNRVEL